MADTTTDLFRSSKTSAIAGKNSTDKALNFSENEGKGSLYPNMGFKRKDGTFRPPDITPINEPDGIWVKGVQDTEKEGVSVSKNRGGFGYAGWCYFLLPGGTNVPAGLDVALTPTKNDPKHHSIRCRNKMRLDAYKGALDNLARNAIVKAVELGKSSLYFSA